MELIVRLWKNFKVQPEIWFFYGFLLTFTLTVRKVLWFFPLRGEFNEYPGIYLYLSDIFLALTLAVWLIVILYNKIDILSILNNVPRGTLVLPIALIVWSFISLIWTENKIVAIFRSVKILEFYLLYFFVLVRFFYCNVPRPPRIDEQSLRVEAGGTSLEKTFGLIMIIGLLQAIIGIIQFLIQHSIGLFWLKESLISPDIAGVAKVIFNGEAFIRAYGLFPHPNIMGGFLLFSIFISFLYYKMFHVEQYDQNKNVPRGTIFKIILGVQLLALILTFSKSAILGLILGLVWYAYMNVPPAYRQASVEQFFHYWGGTFVDFFRKKKRLFVVAGLIIILSVFILKPDWNSLFIKSLDERSVYVNVSPARIAMQSIAGGRGTMEDIKTLIFGVGNSQFVISMENLSVIKENWMLQPVHNVFLLIWSELGMVGLLILIVFVLHVLLKNVPRLPRVLEMFHVEHFQNLRGGTSSESIKTFSAIFIGLLFIMFFDHYLWDIQQGSFLLWMTLGFLVGAGERKNCIDKS